MHCTLDVNTSRYNIVLYCRDEYCTYCSVEVAACEKRYSKQKVLFRHYFLNKINISINKYTRYKFFIENLEFISTLVIDTVLY
jgi:hypothetical protein